MNSTGSFLGIPVERASDAARRAADNVNMHIQALGHDAFRQWVAIRLSDGGSDGNLYPSRSVAIAHQLHATQCAYIRIPPFGAMITPVEAEAFMTYFRSLYDSGNRITGDPDAPDQIMPLTPVAAPGRGARLALPYRGEWR